MNLNIHLLLLPSPIHPLTTPSISHSRHLRSPSHLTCISARFPGVSFPAFEFGWHKPTFHTPSGAIQPRYHIFNKLSFKMWLTPALKLSFLPPLLLRYLGFHHSFSCQEQNPSFVDMRFSQIPLGGLVTSTVAAVATANNLFVSSYAGTISTLQLAPEAAGAFSLKSVAVNTVAQTSPSVSDHPDRVYALTSQKLF